MDALALAKKIQVKHLAMYLVAAFALDRVLVYVEDLWVGTFTSESGILWSIHIVESIGSLLEISMILAFAWLIVRMFVEIRQG